MTINIPTCCLIFSLLLQGCNGQRSNASNTETSNTNQTKSANSQATNNSSEESIWSGQIDGIGLNWTSKELYINSAGKTQKIFGPLVKKGFDDFKSLSNGEDVPSFENCYYERTFELLSVVGTFVSFKDFYLDSCGGAHPGVQTRFTTIDVSKPGSVLYAKGIETPMMNVDLLHLGKIVQLSDLFPEQEILQVC